MDVQQRARQLAEITRYPVDGSVAKAFLAQLAKRNGGVRAQLDSYCRQHGVDKGPPVRIRPAYLYSTVGALYSGAGAPPAAVSSDLYAQALGSNDPVLGALGPEHTNLVQDGRMDANQEFVALGHGFSVFLAVPPAAVTADIYANLTHQWLSCAALLRTGAETQQILGPLSQMMAPFGASYNGGDTPAITTVVGAPGHDGIPPLRPPIVLPAGGSFGIPIRIPAAGFPTDVGYADTVIGIRHCFFGYTRTAVQG